MDKITIHNTNLYYGDFHALKDINLDIPENKITAFIGPNAFEVFKSYERPGGRVQNHR